MTGAYGGANAGTGVSDPLITLLAVQGYVLRHLVFVQGLAAAEDGAGAGVGARSRVGYKDGQDGSYATLCGKHSCLSTATRTTKATIAEGARGGRSLPGLNPTTGAGLMSCPAFEVVAHNMAVQVLTALATYLTDCARRVFSQEAYVDNSNVAQAERCLRDVRRRSEDLFVRYARLERKVKVATNNSNSEGDAFHCSPL
jgi:hypothetical protein